VAYVAFLVRKVFFLAMISDEAPTTHFWLTQEIAILSRAENRHRQWSGNNHYKKMYISISLFSVSVTPSRLFVNVSIWALSYAVASRGTHTYSFLFYRPRSLVISGSGAFYLYHRQ
jgi:hypothetical protein